MPLNKDTTPNNKKNKTYLGQKNMNSVHIDKIAEADLKRNKRHINHFTINIYINNRINTQLY